MFQSLGKWQRQAPGSLGLSIDAQGFTLVALCPVAAGKQPILPWGQADWNGPLASPWQDPLASGAAIHACLKRANIPRWRLAMGLPQDLVKQGTLLVEDGLPAKDIRDQVIWAASQDGQLEWDAVVVDYRCEPQAAAHPLTSGSCRVTWAACGKTWALAADQMSRAAGLSLQFLGVAPELDFLEMAGPTLRYRSACALAMQLARS